MERIISKLANVLVVTLLCAAAVTTANSQDKPNLIDIEALAAKGEAIVNGDTDPLVIEFRNQYPDGPVRRGFDIGMAAAEGHTLLGPGKERICASLLQNESPACRLAVFFSVDRNKHTNLAARGAALAKEDPRARYNLPGGRGLPNLVGRQGFNIGMAAAEGHTLPGPGKQKIHDSLSPGAQSPFSTAVTYSLDRNRFADLAAKGAAIAKADPSVAKARDTGPNLLRRLGFDIATGIFGDPALGALGNTATGPGSLKIRDALSEPAQYGFNESVKFHLGRSYKATSEVRTQSEMEVTRVNDPAARVVEQANDHASNVTAATTHNETARESPVVTKDDHFGRGGATGRARAAFQPENTIKVSVRYKKELGYMGDANAFGNVGPTSCNAFSISVAIGDGSLQKTNPTRISSDSKMEDRDGYYFCNYLASDIPLNQPVRVSVGISGMDQSGAWKGGSYAQPPRGQQRTIIIVSGRDNGPLTLTPNQPRGRQLFEMVYTSQPR